jgi:catechol 2,3-dioxygenase-like lactoylglutathione lyase family enzyme
MSQASDKAGPRLNEIFNLGIKAPDPEAETKFFAAFNPDRSFMVERRHAGTTMPAVEISGVKFFFFPSLAYDADLPEPHPGGIGHVSFMVDSLDQTMAHLEKQGIKPFKGPYSADMGELGKRRVAFYRSPNGTIIEPQELVK